VLVCVLEAVEVAALRRGRSCRSVPLAAVLVCVLEAIEVAALRSGRACRSIPRAVVLVQVLEGVDMAPLSRKLAYFLSHGQPCSCAHSSSGTDSTTVAFLVRVCLGMHSANVVHVCLSTNSYPFSLSCSSSSFRRS